MTDAIQKTLRYYRITFIAVWRRFRSSQNTKLLSMSLIIGLATGLTTWFFRLLIDLNRHFVLAPFQDTQMTFLGVLAPVFMLGAMGLLVGWITSRFVGTERLRGITGIIESVAIGGGRLPFRKMPMKAAASVLSVSGGASVGIEDPSVQIASNMGAYFGHRLRLDDDQRRLLIASGAAGATSAAFNAPIAGVFFALEVIMHGEFSSSAVGVIVLASVISAAFSQSLGISETTLQQPLDFTLGSPSELIFFVPLVLIIPPFAALFIRILFWQMDFWQRRAEHIPYPIRTGVAGLLVGLTGVFFPRLLGSGQIPMNEVLADNVQIALWLLIVLAFGKIVLTAISVSGGFVGGVFTPSLFIGTMLGSFYGQIIVRLVPGISDSRVFAIVGMAGMMVGVVRAPITVIMLVFELTNDYRMILPIMLVAILCMYITQAVQPEGVYARGLSRAGLHLSEGRSVDIMQAVKVEDVMRTSETIEAHASLQELRDKLRATNRRSLVLMTSYGEISGIVTLSDLQAAYDNPERKPHWRVADIASREVITATTNETLWVAVRRMGVKGVGRLPVLERGTGKLVGILNRHDVVRAYNTTVADKIRDQHYAEQIRLQHLTGAHVFELTVSKRAPIANHQIREIKFPGESTVASIQRDGKLLIPHGDTTIMPRDVLTIVAEPEAEVEIARLFGM